MGCIFDIDDTNSINPINLIESGWNPTEKNPEIFVKRINHDERIIFGRDTYKYFDLTLTFVYSFKTKSITFINAYKDMERDRDVNSMLDLDRFVNKTTIEMKNKIRNQMKKYYGDLN